jgi:hypothetical protein
MPNPRDFAPPPPPPLITVDPAEFVELRTIVVALIGTLAVQLEKSGAGGGQSWINGIAEVCADAINGVEFRGVPSSERIRSVTNFAGSVPAWRCNNDDSPFTRCQSRCHADRLENTRSFNSQRPKARRMGCSKTEPTSDRAGIR